MLGLKATLITGGIGLLAVGLMTALWLGAKADAKMEQAKRVQVETVLAATQAQNETLQAALKSKDAALVIAALRSDNAATAAAKSARDAEALKDQLTKEIERAQSIDDGPAAPVLQFAANSLRLRAEAIAALRAGDGDQNRPASVQGAGNPAGNLPAAGGSWPTSQREFAVLAMKFGEYGLACAQDKAGISLWQANENAITEKANAQ